MAIIIEERKSRASLVRLIGWLAVIVIIGVAAYYIFFAAPQLVIVSPSGGLQSIAPISQVTLHPEDVLNSPAFQSLKIPAFPLPSPQGPAAVGRVNPFVSP